MVNDHQIYYKGVQVMKKFVVMMAAALLVSVATVAVAEVKVSGDVYAGPVSKYVFRGLDLSGNRGVIQGGADLSYNGFSLSYWSNYQMIAIPGGYDAGETTETDITLNYSFSPAEILTVNAGNTYYTFDGAEDTNELYLKATLNTLLSPTLAVYYDWDYATKAGLFYTAAVGHTFSPAKNLGISLGALASYNMQNPSADVGANYNGFHNYELTASMDYSINDNIKITPSYLYSNAISSTARKVVGVTDQSVVGIKATFIF